MNPPHLSYRPDIDGLRAFAVLFVVLFHIDERLVPGGFIGVDMFFVISGYLITSIIVRERRAGQFSFAEFYRRRMKRILPAMFLVTAVTLVAGVALLLPKDVIKLSWSALATVFSAANIYFTFFLDTSYFAPSSKAAPLLHMWSLGVEEQFYLIWPALIVLLLRWPRMLIAVIGVIIVASVAISELLFDWQYFSFAYYMLPGRMFELAMGGALVFLPVGTLGGARKAAALPLAIIGAALVAWSGYSLTGDSLFPGLNAVPVAVGTCLLILAGLERNLLSRAIAFRPLVWIGLVSYSLYLWHWPVLAFQHYFYPDLPVTQKSVSFVVMLALSVASYRYVEVPTRRTKMPFWPVALRYLAAPLVVAGVIVAALIGTQGFGPYLLTSYPDNIAQLRSPVATIDVSYICQSSRVTPPMLKNPDCINGDTSKPGEPRILLYGDSNASHFVGLIAEVGKKYGFSFRNVAHSGCPPVYGNPRPFLREALFRKCIQSLHLVRKSLNNYDVIVLGGNWPVYERRGEEESVDFRNAMRRTVNRLTKQGKKVVLMGKVPIHHNFEAECPIKALKAPFLDCSKSGLSEYQPIAINNWMKKLAADDKSVYFFEPADVLCANGRCNAFEGKSALYYDQGHLSADGGWAIGKIVASQKSGEDLANFLTSSGADSAGS